MGFLETVEQARAFLERNGRVSLGALRLEFGLDDAEVQALAEELVETQRIAVREGQVLARAGSAAPRRARLARCRPRSAFLHAQAPRR